MNEMSNESKTSTPQKRESFKVDSTFEGTTLKLTFSGLLNEEVGFTTLLNQISGLTGKLKTVSIDLSGVTRFNSAGVRAWMQFLVGVQQKIETRFSEINEIVIDQASVVPNLLGKPGTVVDKFSAPYYCPKCHTREPKPMKPADVKALPGDNYEPPELNCAKCGTAMSFDSLPEEYFAFLKHHKGS